MSFFSKKKALNEAPAYALEALATGFQALESIPRNRVAPQILSAVHSYVMSQSSWDSEHKLGGINLFKIISGTVGVEPGQKVDLNVYSTKPIRDIMEEILPFNMPLMVLGPVRMVIEEYVNGCEFTDIDFESFDKHDSRQLIHALMKAIESVNQRCIQDPRNHGKFEMYCLSELACHVADVAKEMRNT